ncbi:Sugar transporter STL1 [Fusarium oxysporum f. sp. albedinis]|nr:Sugar transporter STL1 [Fusarium oxysporum f. sp. albedinis]
MVLDIHNLLLGTSYAGSNQVPLLLAPTTQSSRLADANTCDGFCSVADWLESRVLCMLGGLSPVNPA